MDTIALSARVEPDGQVHLRVPAALANSEVIVVVLSGPAGSASLSTEQGWREAVRRTAGTIPDFPDVQRPGPDAYERRESAA